MDSTPSSEIQSVPDDFNDLVENALKNIYDLSYLLSSQLCKLLGLNNNIEIAGQTLRRELVAAIELLNPGEKVPFRAPHARLHNVLVLHYMEQMTIEETAHQLGVSSRQAIRNLRDAENNVASILWTKMQEGSKREEKNYIQLSSIENEMTHLKAAQKPVDIAFLVRAAVDTVQPRASIQGLVIDYQDSLNSIISYTNLVLAQQLLVSLVSYAIGQAVPGKLSLNLKTTQVQQELIMNYQVEQTASLKTPNNPMIVQLAQTLNWSIQQIDQPEYTRRLICRISSNSPTILIIDDNEELVNLLHRYLSEKECRVLKAVNGEEGLALAKENRPSAILLDVMMPGIQGWEVMQRLHNDPDTSHIPIIVCSVINEPELAKALGAEMVVPKPIRQVDILSALQKVGIL